MKLKEILVESTLKNVNGKLGSFDISIKSLSIDPEFYADCKLIVLNTTDEKAVDAYFDESSIYFDYVKIKTVGNNVEVSFGTDPLIEFNQGTDKFRSNKYNEFFHFLGLKPTETTVVNPGSGNTVEL